MKNSKNKKAFTLIELLVVISIIGILASFAIPAVTSALAKGQMTGTLSNARQIHLVTFDMNLENEAAGVTGAWPGNPGVTSIAEFTSMLGSSLSVNDLKKMLSAPGVAAPLTGEGTNVTGAAANNIAFNVYTVGSSGDNTLIFLSTKNWSAIAPADLNASDLPYGDKGFIVFRKGGDGQILSSRFATQTNNVSSNQSSLTILQ